MFALLLSLFSPSLSFVSGWRRNLRFQDPWTGGPVWGGGAEPHVRWGRPEGTEPHRLWAAEGVHLHHPGLWLRGQCYRRRLEEIAQVSRPAPQHTVAVMQVVTMHCSLLYFLSLFYFFLSCLLFSPILLLFSWLLICPYSVSPSVLHYKSHVCLLAHVLFWYSVKRAWVCPHLMGMHVLLGPFFYPLKVLFPHCFKHTSEFLS